MIVAGPEHIFVENAYEENVGNVVDGNLFFSEDGSPTGTWQWKGTEYGSFSELATQLRQ